jgi:hypothetical protein
MGKLRERQIDQETIEIICRTRQGQQLNLGVFSYPFQRPKTPFLSREQSPPRE